MAKRVSQPIKVAPVARKAPVKKRVPPKADAVKRKAGPIKYGAKRKVEPGVQTHQVDMPRLGKDAEKQRNPNVSTLPHGYQALPYDLPVIVDVEQVTGVFQHRSAGDARGLIGWIMTMDCFTMGHKVEIKLYREYQLAPRRMIIQVDGAKVYDWTRNPDDEPSKLVEILTERLEEDGRWAEMNKLEPGDEVLEDDIGRTIVVKPDMVRTAKGEYIDLDPKGEDEIEWED